MPTLTELTGISIHWQPYHADESCFRLGENGHAELTAEGLGDALLALFDKLVRGLDDARLRDFVDDVLAEARETGGPAGVKNLFVLAFQTRWCRGGKGERKLALQLLAVLYERGYREAVLAVTELLPSYGYWKDLLLLLLECKRADVDYTPLHSKVRCLFARQLKADAEELEAAAREGRQPRGLSLAAKFAPSEGGQYSRSLKADKQICRLLYTGLVGVADEEAAWGYWRAKYRHMLSSLRRSLALPQVLMCAQQWTEIDLSSVPSLAMARYKRAYLNEGKGCCKDDPERAACRDNFVKMLQEKGVSALKGKQLFPHQLVEEVLTPKTAGPYAAARQHGQDGRCSRRQKSWPTQPCPLAQAGLLASRGSCAWQTSRVRCRARRCMWPSRSASSSPRFASHVPRQGAHIFVGPCMAPPGSRRRLCGQSAESRVCALGYEHRLRKGDAQDRRDGVLGASRTA